MSEGEWRLVDDYSLLSYANGVQAGDQVRLKHDLVIRDHRGRATGKVYANGEICTILPGVPDEPNVIWLRQSDGERHTWDLEDFFDSFEIA